MPEKAIMDRWEDPIGRYARALASTLINQTEAYWPEIFGVDSEPNFRLRDRWRDSLFRTCAETLKTQDTHIKRLEQELADLRMATLPLQVIRLRRAADLAAVANWSEAELLAEAARQAAGLAPIDLTPAAPDPPRPPDPADAE